MMILPIRQVLFTYRALLAICLFFYIQCSAENGSFAQIPLESEGIVLMNAETGAILFEKNRDKLFYPASITKIATASYALKMRGEHLDRMITAEGESLASATDAEMERSNYNLPSHWIVSGATHIGIKKGEVLSLKDLLYGTLIASGADASNVIAQYIGGTIPTFMQLVNDYLQEIGCQQTHFTNPHGLYHPKHVTTPYDMALMTKEALKNETFREIVKTVRYHRPQTNKQSATTLIQTNGLLKKGKHYYPKAIGVKTGYLSKSQNTLVAAAQNGDRTLIAVLIKCKSREKILSEAIALFEAAFKEKKVKRRLFSAGMQKGAIELPNASRKLHTYLKNDVLLEYFPAEIPELKATLDWRDIQLPVSKDELVGELKITDLLDRIWAQAPLFAVHEVDYDLRFKVQQFFSAKTGLKFLGIFTGVGVLAALLFLLCNFTRRV